MKKILLVFFLLFSLTGCFFQDSPEIEVFSDGLLAVEYNDRWGYVNNKGKMVIPAIYDGAAAFYDNIAIVKIDNKMQLIDKKGKLILSKKYDQLIRDVSSKTITFSIEGKYGLMNHKGEIILESLFDDIDYFYEGLAKVRLGLKYGFINTKGERVIDVKYDGAKSFSQGLAAVKLNDLWGYVDLEGEVYIKPLFAQAYDFNEYGVALVESDYDGSLALLNQKTKTLVIDDQNTIIGNGPIYAIESGNEYRLIKYDGSEFNSEKYHDIWFVNEYFVRATVIDRDYDSSLIWFDKDGSLLRSANYLYSNYDYIGLITKGEPYMTVKD